MKVLYFHGGPGFNSHPENNLLGHKCRELGLDLRLWNEPSALRPKGHQFKSHNAFQNYLDSAEQFLFANYYGEPVVLMGHSFGVHPVSYLVQKHPDKLAKVVLLAPAFSPADVDRNIFTFTMMDFKEHKDECHEKLQEVLKNYTGKFDANTEIGFGLAAQNPRMFSYYWWNKERMGAFLPFYAEPGYGMDIESFISVRRSFFERTLKNSQVPAVAIFGKHDMVISQDKELDQLRKRFSSLEVHMLEESGHYPHIEETGKVLGILGTTLLDLDRDRAALHVRVSRQELQSTNL